MSDHVFPCKVIIASKSVSTRLHVNDHLYLFSDDFIHAVTYLLLASVHCDTDIYFLESKFIQSLQNFITKDQSGHWHWLR